MTPNSLLVFSHPNHEIAVLSAIEAVKPVIVYLTDGGHETRVSETKQALSRLGALENAFFLNYSEASFYAAILGRDAGFFREVRARLSGSVSGRDIDAIFCDAVEFYNPVHDMALPIASRPGDAVPLFEIPLIQQDDARGIRMLTAPAGVEAFDYPLSDAQVAKKLAFLGEIYTNLNRYLAGLDGAAAGYALHEGYFLARRLPIAPPADGEIRYDQRGKLLVQSGQYVEAITYAGCYLPLVTALLDAPA